jgi:hypothetical protein
MVCTIAQQRARLKRLRAAAPAQLVLCPHTVDPVQAQRWTC